MLDEEDKALAVAIRTNACLRLRFNAPLKLQASAMAFLDSVKDEDVFGYITIPLTHLRVCWAHAAGERPTIDSDAALSRAAIQLKQAAIVNAENACR